MTLFRVLFKQNSRIRWLLEGDANTRFFHRAVLANQAKNLIKYLRGEDGLRVDNVDQIKQMIVAYYSNLLGSESTTTVPYSVDKIKSLHPFRCDQTLTEKLIAIPSEEEITRTIFTMPCNKAPGPDGFPVEFFFGCLVCGQRVYYICGKGVVFNLPSFEKVQCNRYYSNPQG